MVFIFILLAMNLGLVVWGVLKSCISRQGIEFNHILMFSIGFVFYWITPIVIGELHFFDTDIRMQVWYGIYDAIPEATVALYLAITAACYLSFFFAGEWVRRRFSPSVPVYHKIFFYRQLLDIPLFIGAAISVIFAVLLRDDLFKGYTAGFDPTQPNALVARGATTLYGSFTGASVTLLPIAFLYAAKRDEDAGGSVPFHKLIFNRFFVIYFFFSILVLSLGGREYFLCSVFMLLIYRSVYFERIAQRTAAGVFLGILGAAGLFGLVRLGSTVSAGGALVNVFLEPLWSGFSLIHFLQANSFEVIRFPIFLVSNFINLIPQVLLPNKVSIMLDPADYGYTAFSPGGAENSFFSFMINFGVIGTILSLGFFGGLLSYIKVRDRNLLFRVIYVMLSGWLGFTFFREPFYLSVVKTMFEFSYAESVVLVLAMQLISLAVLASRKPAETDDVIVTESIIPK